MKFDEYAKGVMEFTLRKRHKTMMKEDRKKNVVNWMCKKEGDWWGQKVE